MVHTREKWYSLYDFPKKTEKISKLKNSEHKLSEDEYQEYLRFKSGSTPQSSSTPSVSTACRLLHNSELKHRNILQKAT